MTRLKQNVPVSEIMTKNPTTVTARTPLSEVGKLFGESSFHHLPVVEGENTLVGIVSFVDLMRVSFEDSFGVTEKQAVYDVLDHTLDVPSIMAKDPTTIHEKDPIKDAARELSLGSFHALPVVNDEHQLVGIVTSADLIKYLLELYYH